MEEGEEDCKGEERMNCEGSIHVGNKCVGRK